MTAPVLAVGPWRTNADLIANGAVPLGYLNATDHVCDPTYGLGRWWTKWRPDRLWASDLDAAKSPTGFSVDFRALPWPTNSADVVTLDPPYKLNGTSAHASDAGYGVHVRGTIAERHALICDGITEAVRVVKPGGIVLVKCQDQVCSGRVQWQTRIFADHAEAAGCRLVDALHLLGHRPQPAGRRQLHARRNYSTLLVLEAHRV